MMLGPSTSLVTQFWWWPAGEKVGGPVPGSLQGASSQAWQGEVRRTLGAPPALIEKSSQPAGSIVEIPCKPLPAVTLCHGAWLSVVMDPGVGPRARGDTC